MPDTTLVTTLGPPVQVGPLGTDVTELQIKIGSTVLRTLPVTSPAGGGGGGGGGGAGGGDTLAPSEKSATVAPVTAQLSLGATVDSGITCNDGSSVSGHVGQWLNLPTECTLSSRSSAQLLGWSTSVDFPVAIAQRQIDNGWGTYELTNEAGQVTAVFIPAGHAALVSGSNALHPVWSA